MACMTGREVEYGLLEWIKSSYPLFHTLWDVLCGQHIRVARGGKWEKRVDEEGMRDLWKDDDWGGTHKNTERELQNMEKSNDALGNNHGLPGVGNNKPDGLWCLYVGLGIQGLNNKSTGEKENVGRTLELEQRHARKHGQRKEPVEMQSIMESYQVEKVEDLCALDHRFARIDFVYFWMTIELAVECQYSGFLGE